MIVKLTNRDSLAFANLVLAVQQYPNVKLIWLNSLFETNAPIMVVSWAKTYISSGLNGRLLEKLSSEVELEFSDGDDEFITWFMLKYL